MRLIWPSGKASWLGKNLSYDLKEIVDDSAKPSLQLNIFGFQLLDTFKKLLALCNPFLIILQPHSYAMNSPSNVTSL